MSLRGILITGLISMIPFIEMRGAIPYGIAIGENPLLVFGLATLINIIGVPIVYFLLARVFNYFDWDNWMKRNIQKRAGTYVDRFGSIGLMIFVGIPIPGSGIFAGCLAALIFGFRKRTALLSISIGLIIAGLLLMLGSLGVVSLWNVISWV